MTGPTAFELPLNTPSLANTEPGRARMRSRAGSPRRLRLALAFVPVVVAALMGGLPGRAEAIKWTITATAGSGGTITPSGAVQVNDGLNQSFAIAPATGYVIADVLVDGASMGPTANFTFVGVNASHTIHATFKTWVITATAGGGGTITPSGAVSVNDGASQSFTITPASGYHVANLLVDGVSVGAVNSYNFSSVNSNHTIAAVFGSASFQLWTTNFPAYSSGGLPGSWGDYDGDGDPDLPLYFNYGNGLFGEMTGVRALLADGNYHGAAWCDYDRDGNVDLALLPYAGEETPLLAGGASGPGRPTQKATTLTHALLLHNQGDGTFVDVAPSLGMDVVGFGETAVWGDFDGDGWPDLFAPYYAHEAPYHSFLYHNNHDGTFTDVAAAAGVDLAGLPASLKPEGAAAVDLDGDGDLDLYCASHLFINDGTGHFTDVRASVGLPEVFDEGATFVDYDNDGDFDLYLRTETGPRLFRNDGGTFTEVTAAAGLPQMPLSWGDSWADVDNDGDLDLYLVGRIFEAGHMMLNQGDGTFVQDATFNFFDSSLISCWADVDRDGDLDLHIDGWNRSLFKNLSEQRPGFAGSYLNVVVLDELGKRTEEGATVSLQRLDGPPGVVQTRWVKGAAAYLAQNEYAAHFGVVPSGTYSLTVHYPSSPSTPVVVGPAQVSWLGNLVPGTLGGQTITVFRDGRAHLGDWTIQATAGYGGTITPSGAVQAIDGGRRTFTIAPAAQCQVKDVVVDGVSVGPVTSYSFANVFANHTIDVSFIVPHYTLAVNVLGNGSVSWSPHLPSYLAGSQVTLWATPAAGFAFAGWSGDTTMTGSPVTLMMNRDRILIANFTTANLFEVSSATFPAYSAGGLPPAWGDYDNDGKVDLPLYRNEGDGTFSEISGFRNLLANGNYHGAAWCDYDRDGKLDLALQPFAAAHADRARLLHNQGDGTFVDVAPALGMDVSGLGATAAWGDFDGDGWPDLFAPYYATFAPFHSFLWHNNGNGTFTDVAAEAGVALANVPADLKPEGVSVADVDGDGDLDIYCASHLFLNDGTGHFTDVREASGLPEVADFGARFVDYDNDGDLDLYLRTAAGPRLFRNDLGHFTEVTAAAGLPQVGYGWGDSWADVDNDGDLDLYLVMPNYLPARLMLNQGNGTFVQDPTFNFFDSSGGSAWADVDRDGDLDLHVEGDSRHLFINRRDSKPDFAGSFLRVLVLDANGRRTEPGATVTLRRVDHRPRGTQTRVVDGGSGFATQGEYEVHFGVAPAGRYALEVSYPGTDVTRTLVDETRVPWFGNLEPAVIAGQTITVFRDGRAHLGGWTVTASAGSGGTIVPSGAVTVSPAGGQSFTIAPSASHQIADVVVDGVSVGPVSSYTFSGVLSDHTIVASFVGLPRTLTVSVVGTGSVAKNPDLPTYPSGSTVTLTALPGPGFTFVQWSGAVQGNTNPIQLTMNGDTAVTAAFGDVAPPNVAVITPNGGENLVVGGSTTLRWTATDNAGVTGVDLLLSRHGSHGPYETLADGTANTGSYPWTVTGPAGSQMILRVRAHDAADNTAEDLSNGAFTIAGPAGVWLISPTAPTALALGPAHPNPTHDEAWIPFGLPTTSHVKLQIVDLAGREVVSLADEDLGPGSYAITWNGRSDGRPSPAGMYFVRLEAGARRLVSRLVLMR